MWQCSYDEHPTVMIHASVYTVKLWWTCYRFTMNITIPLRVWLRYHAQSKQAMTSYQVLCENIIQFQSVWLTWVDCKVPSNVKMLARISHLLRLLPSCVHRYYSYDEQSLDGDSLCGDSIQDHRASCDWICLTYMGPQQQQGDQAIGHCLERGMLPTLVMFKILNNFVAAI